VGEWLRSPACHFGATGVPGPAPGVPSAFEEILEAMPEDPELSVVCFRHFPGGQERATGLDPSVLDHYQDRLRRALEVAGEGWISTTRLRSRTYLRAGIVNYLTTRDDIDGLLATLRRLSPAAAREAGIR
jgi:glutamate/tyrosine decarboxylase-like PLP-dependent enzyme